MNRNRNNLPQEEIDALLKEYEITTLRAHQLANSMRWDGLSPAHLIIVNNKCSKLQRRIREILLELGFNPEFFNKIICETEVKILPPNNNYQFKR